MTTFYFCLWLTQLSGQMTLIEHLTKDDNELMIKIMSVILSNDNFREDFTEYITEEDAPDSVKTFMMGVNEFIAEEKKQEEKK